MRPKIRLLAFSLILLISTSCDVLNTESGRSGYFNGYEVEDIYPDKLTAKLATAAGEGDTQKMDELINQGANVNATGNNGYSLLVWAFKMESLIGFKYLLAKGANPDLYFGLGGDEAMISHIISRSEYDYLEALLEVGANPDLLTGSGPSTPLMDAVYWDDEQLKLVKLLLQVGAQIDFQTPEYGYYATKSAITYNNFDITLYLLQQGANYQLEDFKNRSVITEMYDSRDFLDPERYKYDQFYSGYATLIEWFETEGVDLGFCFNKNNQDIYELCQ
ncbi:ankyrin repeat domain-containing protein [Marinicellulosiphila megalodicopiae]|uniref:ankyrin repeat domain-containing protein n=1 Tax=Marinicellulosiphila megalodicopiae TaxID=2724896 RepID=UPI003BB08EF9